MLGARLEEASRQAFSRRLKTGAGGLAILVICVLLVTQTDRVQWSTPDSAPSQDQPYSRPILDSRSNDKPEGPQAASQLARPLEIEAKKEAARSVTPVEEESARSNQARDQFKGALRDFEEEIGPLIDRPGFSAWNDRTRRKILSTKDEAVDAFYQGTFGKALALLESAKNQSREQLVAFEAAIESAVNAAEKAHFANDYERAATNIENASRWKPDDQEILLLKSTIERLPTLLRHLQSAEVKRRENNPGGELKELRNALKLDPGREDISRRADELTELIEEQRFSSAIRKGLAGVERNDLVEAKEGLRCQSALKFDPLSACNVDPPEWHGGGCPGSQQGGPARLRVALCATRSEAAWGVPVGPPGQPGRVDGRRRIRIGS